MIKCALVNGKLYLLGPIAKGYIRKHYSNRSRIEGVIKLSVTDIIMANNHDDFLDMLSERLVGNNLLMDIDYELLALSEEPDTFLIRISGDISAMLQDWKTDEEFELLKKNNHFKTKWEAERYRDDHGLYVMVPEFIRCKGSWALVYPLKPK